MIFRFLLLLSLLFLIPEISAQTVSFHREMAVGTEQTVRIRLVLSREYTFMIPGAGKAISKVENMDLVLLTDLKIKRMDKKNNPVELQISPRVLGGTVNGRRIDPELLQERKIQAVLDAYPCKFIAEDGKELSGNALTILAAIFRVQPEMNYADFLGTSRTFRQGESWLLQTAPLLNELKKRNLALTEKNFQAYAKFENKFKVQGIDCTAVVLNIRSAGTHNYDFRVKTRIVLPIKETDGGILSISREGVEVVDKKMMSNDPAAAGASVRVVTTEQMESVFVPVEKKEAEPSRNFFQDLFR